MLIEPVEWWEAGHPFVPGQHYLIYDPEDRDWALWRAEPGHIVVLVNWLGRTFSNPETLTLDFEGSVLPERSILYPITPEHADTCVMAARHLAAKDGWYRFANRQVT